MVIKKIIDKAIIIILITCKPVFASDSISIIPPLNINLLLSGTYGEIRTNHFHSGTDFKTQGKSGFPVYAIEDGYVFRIKISSKSYGKSLYIMNNNGLTSVYGHLNNFIPEIEKYTKHAQYKLREFEIDLFPEKNLFHFKKGDLIAYSGNTGYSFGPHLHFEIRESKTEIPVNALLFYNQIQDTIAPVIKSIMLYAINEHSYINFKNEKQKFPVIKNQIVYTLSDTSKINVSGPFGIGIETFDLLNNSGNKCGIYSITLFIDDTIKTKIVVDSIPFDKTRYINSYIDYEEKIKNKIKIQKLYIEPNNKLDIYKTINNNGIIEFNDDLSHKIKIEIADAAKNISQLNFETINNKIFKGNNISDKNDNFSQVLYYQTVNEFINNDIEIVFPENCFYTNINFEYAKQFDPRFKYSPVHYIHNIYTPVHNKFKISVKPDSIPAKYISKAVICAINDDADEDEHEKEIEAVGGEKYQNGFITAYCNEFGKYVVELDTIAPEITPLNFTLNDKNFSNKKQIEFKITDNLSKIKSYNGFIDGNWVLFEYSLINEELYHIFDKAKTEFGKMHSLELYVIDEINNVSKFSIEFKK